MMEDKVNIPGRLHAVCEHIGDVFARCVDDIGLYEPLQEEFMMIVDELEKTQKT